MADQLRATKIPSVTRITIACNLGGQSARVPAERGALRVRLASDAGATLVGGGIQLPPES